MNAIILLVDQWLNACIVVSTCIGEGDGNPLQCSCLENPRDGGAWWAAVRGVAQSRTRLKRRSSSSSSQCHRQLLDIGENLHILGGQSEVSFVSSEGDNRRGTAVGGKNRYFSSFR